MKTISTRTIIQSEFYKTSNILTTQKYYKNILILYCSNCRKFLYTILYLRQSNILKVFLKYNFFFVVKKYQTIKTFRNF